MRIELTDFEKKIGVMIAKKRFSNARKNGIINRQISYEDPLEPDLEGTLSELAMCKILNVYPEEVFNFNIRSVENKTDNGDLKYKGKCLDVKATKYKSGRLIATQKNDAVDYLCLMTGSKGEYNFAGAMNAKDFYTEARWGKHDKLRVSCYCASQEELIPAKNFLTLDI